MAREAQWEIEVKDFGPIRAGVIELKPLTILMGPNNAGKSYVAMLTHALLESTGVPNLHSGPSYEPLNQNTCWSREEFGGLLDGLRDSPEVDVPKTLAERLFKHLEHEVFPRSLAKSWKKYLPSPDVESAVRFGTREFQVNVTTPNGTARIRSTSSGKIAAELTTRKIPLIFLRAVSGSHLRPTKEDNRIGIELGQMFVDKDRPPFIHEHVEEVLLSQLLEYVFQTDRENCVFLPSSRAGILDAQKALSKAFMSQAMYAGTGRIDIPALPGSAADLILMLGELPRDEGPFSPIAAELEADTIQGQIRVTTVDSFERAVEYAVGTNSCRLPSTSSSVSELAPVILAIRFFTDERTVFILEEPEAHLHPLNQRHMAKCVARLVRAGATVVVTTHSDIFVEQLNNYIRAGSHSAQKRQRSGLSKDDYIEAPEVAAYLFDFKSHQQGSEIAKLNIDSTEGIASEQFLEIKRALYDEELALVGEEE